MSIRREIFSYCFHGVKRMDRTGISDWAKMKKNRNSGGRYLKSVKKLRLSPDSANIRLILIKIENIDPNILIPLIKMNCKARLVCLFLLEFASFEKVLGMVLLGFEEKFAEVALEPSVS